MGGNRSNGCTHCVEAFELAATEKDPVAAIGAVVEACRRVFEVEADRNTGTLSKALSAVAVTTTGLVLEAIDAANAVSGSVCTRLKGFVSGPCEDSRNAKNHL